MTSSPYASSPQQEQSSQFARPARQKNWFTSFVRIFLIAGAVTLICIYVLRPVFLNGTSMMPTYSNHVFTFALLPYFKIYAPQRQQIVILSHPKAKSFFIKRIIAFPGDTVEIRNGVLYLNNRALNEPYVKYQCKWNMTRCEVPKGKIFVLGDNRSMPMREHMGGLIDQRRLVGVPIW